MSKSDQQISFPGLGKT